MPRTRYLVIVGLVLAGFSAWSLVQNQAYLSNLADTVVAKDQAGLDTTVEVRVAQDYAAAHMGVVATVTLQASYDRALAASVAAASSANGGNGAVYAAAQAACGGGHADSITQARCVSNYVAAHSTPAANPVPAVKPVRGDYEKTFKGPAWSFDSVGLLLMAAFGCLVLAIFSSFRRRA